ncbi:hypothetical protein WALSEDRAFT_69026 [Wallemia mellicola CBS 633.66]|uniref:Uncharacterized protein n=1 Tax=Wallemia mellicola (strain ATCC MYA-4683 / CBS 633.66) TaxID=671144 RepID=I4YBW4_WALMC|nr:hypothetical protein WALSEDRAFT_69026 [Wallemia mellicola CBS 633.66]EIM21456.1 hypothetical protein WALSEDRAFT_69026 [Wallemia mellicola CBS 633.66]TIC10758.1 hypothetical protein E3Q14_02639 [Wallemia mellicola]|eukprot:XP_006958486.1 hypothetical protein WALSEDRAFT_69026 [Wallemia mellicola CBS 633.66]
MDIDVNILGIIYKQVIVDVATSLKNPQSKESSEILKKRIQSFEAIAENIETRIRRTRDVIARDINKHQQEIQQKEVQENAPEETPAEVAPTTIEDNSLSNNTFSIDFDNSLMGNDLDLFGDPYLS